LLCAPSRLRADREQSGDSLTVSLPESDAVRATAIYTALRNQHVPPNSSAIPGSYHRGWAAWDMMHRYYRDVKWFGGFLP
jgi:hypothetical protein